MFKNFDEWNTRKKNIHYESPRPYFHEREIWWASLGLNVGYEQDGKHDMYERPVVIFRKFNNDIFWALPISSRVKGGRHNFVYTRQEREFSIILSQIRLLDAKRLRRKFFTLSPFEFCALERKFLKLLT